MNANTLAYLNAAKAKLDDESNELLTTTTCHDCDNELGVDLNPADHFVLPDAARGGQEVVVIGCQGYYEINPASVGIESENWMGIEGVNV